MTFKEEKAFVSTMLFDFRLSLYNLRTYHLESYEIDMIAERYDMPKKDLIKILNKIYDKTISSVKAKKAKEW